MLSLHGQILARQAPISLPFDSKYVQFSEARPPHPKVTVIS